MAANKTTRTSDGAIATLPKPPVKRARDDPDQQSAYKIFEYWDSIPDSKAEVVEFRVYRMWPIVDVRLIGKSTKEEKIFHGKIPFRWQDWKDQFFHEFGSGAYKCYLNEAGVTGSIMEAWFSLQDWDKYPPKIDLRALVQGVKENDDYIHWLRRNGTKLPWDDPVDPAVEEQKKQEIEDMTVASEAISSLAETNVKLAERIAEARTDKGGGADATIAQDMGDIYKGAARGAVEVMKESAGHQYNVVEVIGALKEVMAPPPNNDMVMVKMLLETQNAANERLVSLQNSIIENLRKPDPGVALVQQDKGGIEGALDTLEKFKRVGEVIGWGPSRRNTEAPSPAPAEHRPGFWESLFGAVRENPSLAQSAIAGVGTLVASVVGLFRGPTPYAPPQNGQTQPPQQQAPAQPAQEEPWENRFMFTISHPFLAHFSDPQQCSGYTLAEFVISDFSGAGPSQQGRANYEKAKELLGPKEVEPGKPALCRMHMLIMSLPQLQPIRDAVKDLPKRYTDFINQFFTYDEALAAESGPQPVPDLVKPAVV